MSLLLIGFILLLDLCESGRHDAAAINERHRHVCVRHGLDQVRLVGHSLLRLRQEELSNVLLRATTLQSTRGDLCLILVRIDCRVGGQHGDRK